MRNMRGKHFRNYYRRYVAPSGHFASFKAWARWRSADEGWTAEQFRAYLERKN